MKVPDERLAEFNGRMNDWIAKQGLLFQLTHGGTGLGGRPPIIGALLRTLISFTLLLLLAAFGYGAFLFWKATGDELPRTLKVGISEGMRAEELKAVGFKRTLGSGRYKQILVQGSPNSFYNKLEVRNANFPMEPLDGLFGTWNAKTLSFGELEIALKAGEANDERANSSWQSLFEERPSFSFSKIEATSTTLSWGYSAPATWGNIIDSQLVANRTTEGWSLLFRGGTFSQGIFRDCQIEELKVELNAEEGFSVPSARLLIGDGSFEWSAKMVSGGASPELQIEGKLTQIPLNHFLPRGLLAAVSGTFSGELTASGSINDAKGIRFQIAGQAEGPEGIYLTKEFPALGMLSHLDPNRSYRKLAFNQGSFQLNTNGDELAFSDINLQAHDSESSQVVSVLRGNFLTRPTTAKDLSNESVLLKELEQNSSETIGAAPQSSEGLEASLETEILERFRSLQFDNPHQELFYFTKDSSGEELLKNRLDLTPRRTFRMPHLAEGELELAVPANAFANSIQLPMVTATQDWPDLRWFKIDLNNLILRSSKNLTDKWEKALEDAIEEDS